MIDSIMLQLQVLIAFHILFAVYCSPESQQNALLFSAVIQELHHEFGGQENCLWPAPILKGMVLGILGKDEK